MDYTIKNLREVEDMAASQGFGEVQEARFAHGDLDAEQIGVSLQRVKPGKRHAFAHRHKEAEEIYFVISGSGRVKLDDDLKEVTAFDAIRVGPPSPAPSRPGTRVSICSPSAPEPRATPRSSRISAGIDRPLAFIH